MPDDNNALSRQTRRSRTSPPHLRLLLLLAFVIPVFVNAQSSINQISVAPAPGLPSEFVTELEILFVYDSNLLNQLPFTQFEWISSKELYLERDDELLDILALTVNSDSPEVQLTLPARANEAAGVLVFASHEDPVAEALDISFESSIVLQIESYGINVLQH